MKNTVFKINGQGMATHQPCRSMTELLMQLVLVSQLRRILTFWESRHSAARAPPPFPLPLTPRLEGMEFFGYFASP